MRPHMLKRHRKGAILVLAFTCLFACMMSGLGEAHPAGPNILRAVHIPPTQLTPGRMTSPAAGKLAGAVYDWLVRAKPGGKIELQPELATDWQMSSDGLQWTIHLREGVQFHDGSEFTAEDVIFTVARMQDPDFGHPLHKASENIAQVYAVDPHTVIFDLAEPNLKFLYMFTDYNAAILSSAYDYDNLGEVQPMGTGPFKVEQLIPGEGCILVKNESYWMQGAPLLDEIHWTWISDKSTQLMMLESGETDFVARISPVDAERIGALEDAKLYTVPFQENRVIYMRADRPPFADNGVRLAVKYAIDEELLRDIAYGNLSEEIVIGESPIAPLYPEYAAQPPRERDIEKAQELLQQAGYDDGLSVDLYYASNLAVNPEIALIMREMLKPAGITVNLVGLPRDIYLSKYWLSVDFGITGWAQRMDPATVLNLAYKSGAPWNESHYSNAEVDQLIDKVGSALSRESLHGLYAQLQALFYERGPIVVVSAPLIEALDRRVHGFQETINFYGDWRFVYLDEQ